MSEQLIHAARDLVGRILQKKSQAAAPLRRSRRQGPSTRRATVPQSAAGTLIAAAWLHDIGYRSLLRDRGFHPLGRSTCAGKAGPSPCAILSRIIPVAASSRAFAGSTINCASSN
jgi:hypothetical protein